MSTGWDRSKVKDSAQILYHCVATIAAIAGLVVAAPKALENLSALPSLLWQGEHGCRNIIVFVLGAEVALDWAIAARQDQSRASSAMKVGAVLLLLTAVFVISDVCPRFGIAILNALGRA